MSLVSLITSIIRKSSIIEKGKKYVKPGVQPPKGVALHRGPKGGSYYFVEDKHLKQQGKSHELVRSKGVTQDQFKDVEAHYKSKGAESVHFVNMPNVERNKEGKKLYNIYVRHGDTDQRLADKAVKDKARYGHPRKKPEPSREESLKAEMGNQHPKLFFTKKLRAMHPDAHHTVIQSASGAAHAKYNRSVKDGHPNPISDGLTNGNIHAETSKKHPLPFSSFNDVQADIMAEREKRKPAPVEPVKQPVRNPSSSDPYKDWTQKTFKTSKEAETQIQYFQSHGYDVKDYTTEDNGKKQTHTFQVRKKPIPPSSSGEQSPGKKTTTTSIGLKKDSEYQDRAKAEKYRADLERDGYHAEVRPKKIGKTTVYGVYRGKNTPSVSAEASAPEKTNSISIPHDPKKNKAWLSRMHSYEPDREIYDQYGRDFINPSETSEGKHHFRDLQDGLYEQRGSGDVNTGHFVIENGQKRDIPITEFRDHLKQLPTTTRKEELVKRVPDMINKVSTVFGSGRSVSVNERRINDLKQEAKEKLKSQKPEKLNNSLNLAPGVFVGTHDYTQPDDHVWTDPATGEKWPSVTQMLSAGYGDYFKNTDYNEWHGFLGSRVHSLIAKHLGAKHVFEFPIVQLDDTHWLEGKGSKNPGTPITKEEVEQRAQAKTALLMKYFDDLKKDWDIEVNGIEERLVNPDKKFNGTVDLIATLTNKQTGEKKTLLSDFKTGSSPRTPRNKEQIAIYSSFLNIPPDHLMLISPNEKKDRVDVTTIEGDERAQYEQKAAQTINSANTLVKVKQMTDINQPGKVAATA